MHNTLAIVPGMEKTGTTSLQYSFFRHLEDPNFSYVHFGKPNPNRELKLAFRSNNATPDVVNPIRRCFAEQLTKPAGTTKLLVAEHLSVFEPPALNRLKDFLDDHCDAYRIIYYVRPPHSYLPSLFQQRLKYLDLANLIWKPKYKTMVERVEQCFGRQSTDVRLFERRSLYQGDVVRDFCHLLGIEFDARKIVHLNASLSYPAASLLYWIKDELKSEELDVPTLHLVYKLLLDLKGKNLKFTNRFVEEICSEYREEVDWIETRLDLEFETPETDIESNHYIDSLDELLRPPESAFRWLCSEAKHPSMASMDERTALNLLLQLVERRFKK